MEDSPAHPDPTGHVPHRPAPPWEGWRSWEPGLRVMVRSRLPEGTGFLYTDVLGSLVSLDDAGLVVRRRDGQEVAVAAEAIVTGKTVPPPPPRRRPRSATPEG